MILLYVPMQVSEQPHTFILYRLNCTAITCIMADDECIKLCTACNTILHPEVNPMFCAAGGVIYPHLHWPLGKKLRVHFRVRNKFPTWRMESSNPRAELITSDQILDIANIWRRCGGDAIPELVKTENKQESDIRVFLSGKFSCTQK